ncbi:MAG TPA: hypothetical protein VK590_00280 [Saprospiraceae bacterium]|nr:hypothetical protein [Saprospiraceae bacterium]
MLNNDDNKKNNPKVWNESYKTEGVDGQMYVRLIESDYNDIILVICDKHGDEIEGGSKIISLDFDYNILILSHSLNKNFPLKTDFKGEPLIESLVDVVRFHNEKMFKIQVMEQLEREVKSSTKEEYVH